MLESEEKIIKEILSEKCKFKPCPFCGNTKIGVEDDTLDHFMIMFALHQQYVRYGLTVDIGDPKPENICQYCILQE